MNWRGRPLESRQVIVELRRGRAWPTGRTSGHRGAPPSPAGPGTAPSCTAPSPVPPPPPPRPPNSGELYSSRAGGLHDGDLGTLAMHVHPDVHSHQGLL